MESLKQSHKIDSIGQGLSAICLVHCLLLPIAISTLPFLGIFSFLTTPFAEWMLIIVAILNASIAVTSGFKKHNNYLVLTVFISGFLFLMAHVIFDKGLHSHDTFAPTVTLGAFLLGVGHILNKKLCQSCNKCAAHEPTH
jgi:hypothetical protein